MIVFQRRKLGTVYTKSPAQNLSKFMADNMSKVVFSIFMCIAWLAVLYVLVGVVNFVGGQVGDAWERDLPTANIYNHPYCFPIKVIGIICVIFYVFRDKRIKR
ncbi:MAG: hypothetical protein A2X49_04740 [Lentisphaerae bacterium GWF2_52_8]|nr:MAG: hypothetical protein A2X49_04740 [Lentisphaerae bacterium GWF2_52_8]